MRGRRQRGGIDGAAAGVAEEAARKVAGPLFLFQENLKTGFDKFSN